MVKLQKGKDSIVNLMPNKMYFIPTHFTHSIPTKMYNIHPQNNVQNKNKVHFLNSVLYASHSVVSMV